MLLRSILAGGVWNGFLMGKTRRDDVKCRCCGDEDGDGHLFRGCFLRLIVHVREQRGILPLLA